LIRKSVTYSFATNSHMNIRSNSVRSLGSLIQCLGAMTKWVQLSDFKEVEEICSNAIDAVVAAISKGKVMKVRWNACYAAGNILRTTTSSLFCSNHYSGLLIQALIPVIAVGSCPNYKVRINASLALSCVPSREAFGDQFLNAAFTIVKAIESAVTEVTEITEVEHRYDLINQLCATWAYLLSITTPEDITILESQLVGQMDLLLDTMKSVLLRISPEKTSVFVEAKRHLTSETINKKELFPTSLIDALSCNLGIPREFS